MNLKLCVLACALALRPCAFCCPYRQVQDEFAAASHRKAAAAQAAGKFNAEIVPVHTTVKDPKSGNEQQVGVLQKPCLVVYDSAWLDPSRMKLLVIILCDTMLTDVNLSNTMEVYDSLTSLSIVSPLLITTPGQPMLVQLIPQGINRTCQ